MVLSTSVSVPTAGNHCEVINIESGTSIVFIGANGAGKTRLGVWLDKILTSQNLDVHRISAHRSLKLDPNVIAPSFENAQNMLLYGNHERGIFHNKNSYKYNNKPETEILSDFDYVISALYANYNDMAIKYFQDSECDKNINRPDPYSQRLKKIWEKLHPRCELVILSGNFKTKPIIGEEYSSSEMSDGERVTFYLIAQALLAKPDTLLIFDEPELHINRAILDKLWDEIEAARPDCCFLYITHDIEFARSRFGATKYVLRSFQREEADQQYHSMPSEPKDTWNIKRVPEDTQLPEDIVATIVGSRRPILFVEGEKGSLDVALYRRVYSAFTVIPVGSCAHVIHSVATFAEHPDLHYIGCAGIVDSDGRTEDEREKQRKKGIYLLPVSEVENLLLLPDAFMAWAEERGLTEEVAQEKLKKLKKKVFEEFKKEIDNVCLRYTKRYLVEKMKSCGVRKDIEDIENLDSAFQNSVKALKPQEIYAARKLELKGYLTSGDYEKILLAFDNKTLLAGEVQLLGYNDNELQNYNNYNDKRFIEFIGRALRSDPPSPLYRALEAALPKVTPKS